MTGRWVCLDVGEVLVDETRVWATWADTLEIPRLTFAACLGGVVARGRPLEEVFDVLGVDDWAARQPAVQDAFGGIRADDLYPDAWRAIDRLRARGLAVAVIGNQPARRHAELTAAGIAPDVMAMSEELGAEKPDPAFFTRALGRIGGPDPADVAYVGDRVDNDVGPARAAGLRSVWLRRGPWGLLQADDRGDAHLVVGSLDALVERIDEAFEQPDRA